MIEREAIVEKLIEACKNFDFDNIVPLVKDEKTFAPDNQNVFLAELKSVFKRSRARRIKELKPSVSFCDLCFFKEEIVTFFTSVNKPVFSLMFNTDDGYVKDITIGNCVE